MEENSATWKRKGLILSAEHSRAGRIFVHLKAFPRIAALSGAAGPFQVDAPTRHLEAQAATLTEYAFAGVRGKFHLGGHMPHLPAVDTFGWRRKIPLPSLGCPTGIS